MVDIPYSGKQMCFKTALLGNLSARQFVGIPTAYPMTLNLHGPRTSESPIRTPASVPESISFLRQS